MDDIGTACNKCEAPLPEGASFCPECGTVTPTGIRKETGAAADPEKTDTSEAEFRQRLQNALGDGYELRELIGRGGFGVVYAARDVNLKREVAVKAIRFDLLHTESLMERFRREAESVAKLRHPNVVPIYSIGLAEGFAYFTMPRLEGTNLADFFDGDTRLSVREAHRVFRELAGALAAAHRAGIIHRDIKPENVFLEDPERRALLMDFGIAKTDDDADAGKLTGTGMIVGTPHYMSPEQAAGDRHIDHRSDIYSLGVVAYQLFSGKTPFKETSSQKIIVERLTTTPEDLAIGNPAVPEDIAVAVMRCLEREPDDRWNSMVNLISVLDTVEVPEDEDAELLLAGATPIEAPTRKGWMGLVAAAVGLFAGWVMTYGIHSAPAIDNPAVTKAEAQRIAGDYLVGLDTAGAFTSSMLAGDLIRTTGFNRASGNTRQFLLETLGFDESVSRVRADLPVSDWQMRWREPDGTDRWEVRVGANGGIKAFTVHLDADEQGAQLSEDLARAVADSFLVRQLGDISALDLRGARSQREARRTDHFFTLRDKSIAIPWTSKNGAVDSAFVELNVDVSGDQVTHYERVLRLPGDFSTPSLSSAMGAIVAVLSLGAVVYGFGLVLSPKRRRFVRWKPAVTITAVVSLLSVAGWVSSIPGQLHSGDNVTVGSFLLSDATNDLLGLLFIGAGFVMFAMGAIALARDVFPAHVASWENLMSGRWRLQNIGPPVLVGYLAGLAIIGIGDLVTVLLWPIARTTFTGEPGYLTNATAFMPFIGTSFGSAAIGIPIAFATLFAVALGRHLFKSNTLAVALPVVLLLVAAFPFVRGGDTGAIGAAIVIVVLALTALRFGVLAGAIAATMMSAEEVLHLIASGVGPYVTNGIMALGLLLVPGLIVGVAYLRPRVAK